MSRSHLGRCSLPKFLFFCLLALSFLVVPCSSALYFTPSCVAQGAEADDEARLILRGPYLQSLLATSVEVRFSSLTPWRAGVTVIDGEGEETTFLESLASVGHRVHVDGLLAGATYRYRIVEVSGDELAVPPATRVVATDVEWSFRTSPGRGGTFRAAVLGDSGVAAGEQETVAELISEQAFDLFLHTGDVLYVDRLDAGVFSPYRDVLARSCFYPARGNHDLELRLRGIVWRDVFSLPNVAEEPQNAYYSFDWGAAHFTMLDWFHPAADDSVQSEFLVEDLERALESDARWRIVCVHVPIYTIGVYAFLRHPLREELPEICDRYGVDLVLSGHDHNYQRTVPLRAGQPVDAWQDPDFTRPGGTTYIVTGGGGARLYPRLATAPHQERTRVFHQAHHAVFLEIGPERLAVEALHPSGELLDRFEISKVGERPALRVLRGDANGDGRADVSDALATLDQLFLGESPLRCLAAARVSSADARVTITEVVYLLRFLFTGGPPPVAPWPLCAPLPETEVGSCLEAGC